MTAGAAEGAVELYWLPLGAGGFVVRASGWLYEAMLARRDRRPRRSLYHSALVLRSGGVRSVVEMTPAWLATAPERGVVLEGPVGSRLLGRSRAFQYEVRLWPDGIIGDVDTAVGGPVLVTDDPDKAAVIAGLVARVPVLTWGRDESGAGDMWNSNSLVAWLLVGAGLAAEGLTPPGGGRAPGWSAGCAVARRRGLTLCRDARKPGSPAQAQLRSGQ